MVEEPDAAREGDDGAEVRADDHGDTGTLSPLPFSAVTMDAMVLISSLQPRPYAAIELIHKQPVRWTHERKVACDGGGGPLGHPKIFINVDKPQVNFCTYCGLPYVRESPSVLSLHEL